jgi:flagellar capping protein FliD
MASISSTGIGSGLDVTNIVNQLVALEKKPLKTLELKATTVKAQVSAMGDIKSQISTLTDVASRISASNSWTARTATSGNPAAAGITATNTAAATNFTLDVDALATKQSVSSPTLAQGSPVGAGTLTFRLGTWAGVSNDAATDNTGVANADAALPAAQAALTIANTNLTTANTTLSNASDDLATADAILASATTDSDAANLALTVANATLATATTNANAANATLTSANNTLAAANTTFNNASTAATSADAAFATASTNNTNASSASAAAAAASSVAQSDLATALNNNNTAASALAAYALGAPAAQSYSNAYTAWVTAIAANDKVTPSLIAAEAGTLAAKNIAYGALSAPEQAAADAITAPTNPADASSLKVSALSAASTASAAAATATTASTALATATTNQTNANAALATATSALATATADQAAAASAASSAAADLATATSDRIPLAAAAAAANATTASANTARTNAAAAVATATSAVATATSAVTNATTAVTNATNGITSARPTFTPAVGRSDVSITATATDTVATLAAKINAANAGVVATAFFDGTRDRLQLVSKDTGAAAGFRVQVDDTGDSANTDNAGLSRFAYDPQTSAFGMASSGIAAKYGQDARARINGLAVTSSSNTLTGNMPGVTIDLKAVTTSSVAMTISEDVTPGVKNINDFVTAYNALNKTLADLTKYDAATKTASLFQADSNIIGLQSVMRNMLSSITSGSTYQRLVDIGLERQLDGSLNINTAKLSTAANNGNELQKLFTTDNGNPLTNGFALKFATLGRGLLGAGGAVTNKENALQTVLNRNAADQTKVNDRAAAVEARLRKTYSALDAKMAGLNALNAYVAQQVTTWNKSTG